MIAFTPVSLSCGGQTPVIDPDAALRYHVIEQIEAGDRIEIPLIAQWIRERANLTLAKSFPIL